MFQPMEGLRNGATAMEGFQIGVQLNVRTLEGAADVKRNAYIRPVFQYSWPVFDRCYFSLCMRDLIALMAHKMKLFET